MSTAIALRIVHDEYTGKDRKKRLYENYQPSQNPFVKGWQEGNANSKFRLPRMLAYFFPYINLGPQLRTVALEKVFQKILERGESPFTRSDSPELLKKFQYGIIDNSGNLVLLKHPRDESAKELTGWEMLKKMFAWYQPAQRTRFEIQKPKIREKVKKHVIRPWFLPAGARMALAPVRLRKV